MADNDNGRNVDGTFKKGVSGNPKGRPPSKRNRITELQQDMQIAIRERVSPAKVQAIVDAMIKEAEGGSIGAARLILDKFVPNASSGEDVEAGRSGLTIVIKNAAEQAQPNVVEADYTKVEDS